MAAFWARVSSTEYRKAAVSGRSIAMIRPWKGEKSFSELSAGIFAFPSKRIIQLGEVNPKHH
jgi:hypothetical protein